MDNDNNPPIDDPDLSDLDETSVDQNNSVDVNLVDDLGQTPLIHASISGDIAEVQLLINSGANVNHVDYVDNSALIYASSNGHVEVVQLLINNGANVNPVYIEGNSALINASVLGHVEVVQLLINNNANLEIRNEEDYTALLKASIWGQSESVRLLVNGGANINNVDNEGNSALLIAIKNKNKNLAIFLIKNDIDVELRDNEGYTAIFYSSSFGMVDVTELLIEKGANFNQFKNIESTPLTLASQNNHISTVKSILDSEADLAPIDNKGYTALHHAYSDKNIEVARLLINEGANVAESLFKTESFRYINPNHKMFDLLISRLPNFHPDSDFAQRTLTFFLENRHSSHLVNLLIDLGVNVNLDQINLSEAYTREYENIFNTLVSHDANIYQLKIFFSSGRTSMDHTLNIMRGIHACREAIESIPTFNYYIEHVLGLPFTLPSFILQLSFRIPAHFATNYAVTFYVKGLALGILDLQPLKHSLTYAASTLVNELILPQTYDQNTEINSINQFISQCTLPSLSGAFFGYILSSLSPNNLPTIFGAIKGGTTASLQCYSAHKITHLEKSDDYLVKSIDSLVGIVSAISVVPYANYDGNFIKFYELSFIIHNMMLADVFAKTNIGLIKNSILVIRDSADQVYETVVETLGSIKTNVENYLFAVNHEEL